MMDGKIGREKPASAWDQVPKLLPFNPLGGSFSAKWGSLDLVLVMRLKQLLTFLEHNFLFKSDLCQPLVWGADIFILSKFIFIELSRR